MAEVDTTELTNVRADCVCLCFFSGNKCLKFQDIFCLTGLNEPVSSKRYKSACAPDEDSDQPVHLRSPIRVFDVCSMDSQAFQHFLEEN